MNPRVLAVIATGLFLVGDAATQDGKSDKEKIQGDWKVVKHQEDGQDAREVQTIHNVVVTNKLMSFRLKDGGTVMEMTYKLDTAKKPKWIDFTVKEVTYLGIYELEGDTLKICINERGVGPGSKDRGAIQRCQDPLFWGINDKPQ